MKKTYHRLGALLLALALCLSLTAPSAAAEGGGSEALSAAAKSAASAAMSYGQATQIGWAVWRDGEIVESGYDFEYREDPTLGHLASLVQGTTPPPRLYGIGSVSKIYTTVAVMQLAEAGKLDLDQPVTKYLPNFKMADQRYKDITVRMLLNHSSGLMGSSFSSGLLFDDTSSIATDQLLERLSTQRLKADPGAYSVYCNDGFTLAELVVEAVSGMDFMDYLRANILDPAGLEETYDPEGASGLPVAATYQGEDPRVLPMDCLGVVGAGGLYATAEDAAAFGGALTDETLLTKASLEAMAAPEYAKGLWPEKAPSSLAFGLGWDNVEWYPFDQNGITALVKGGDTQYYHAGLVVIPEYKLAAAVLSSGGVSTYNEMAASQMLIAALRQEGVEVAELRLKLPAAQRSEMPQELLDSAGYYGSQIVYQIQLSGDGTLTMRLPATPDLPPRLFYYHDDGTFRDQTGKSALRFVKEDNGQTYLYQWSFTSLSGLGSLPTSNYAAMKLPENSISQELQDQWDSVMEHLAVLPMNERYSSQVYLSMKDLLQTEPEATKSAPGYVGTLRVEDESHARYVVQCPGSGGRDGSDIELRRDAAGNIWYYQAGGVYMDMSAAPALSTGKDNSAVCTIQPDGYARWYKIGENAAGKTMSVRLPQDAGFWVYDSEGNVTASSVLWGDSSVRLYENDLAVFAGDPGARFELTFE